MADAKDGNSGGDHSSGDGQARLTEEITIAKSPGKGRDVGIVISSGDNTKRDRAERKARKEAAEKKAKGKTTNNRVDSG
ncbi:hypothetical protein VC83_09517 [Pseudogymnoascus destructans]|uniref:Uncharacterized protein n=1 Tax=Pseudogymnoascus destructans TaxID=655981 RepID=A0A176ZZE0_9PEZI|nr:uncharacterized protein VC83_09551 [Pseudogymnoascus destructans]XP_024319500.1 uncharacterized protein VC83_09517 [Pseudogymnoascus destructans]OAF54177.1 hypothetical protein VC83_09551 [Pseudogymnoascus destructans]OAF54193.1 hypothetical protein VC83_09517 [Pseudogymnoascus destructans]